MANKSKTTKKSKISTKANALVVVESPAKAKTIEKYLGEGYTVRASKGHVADLPKSGLGVDVDNNFEPEYGVMPGKDKVLKELKKEFKDKDKLIIAVDPDREGEAIGWHVANQLGMIDLNGKRKNKKKELERIVFTEITKDAVQSALKSPRELDFDLLNSQQTRRILDRLVGYKLSPLLWKKIRYGLSAGRVQSVAVKLIVERELEREAFDSEEYWKLFADIKLEEISQKPTKFSLVEFFNKVDPDSEEKEKENKFTKLDKSELRFELAKLGGKKLELNNNKDITKLVSEFNPAVWEISEIKERIQKRNPKPAFTTSVMQQSAGNKLGYTAKRTMSIAQKLYENGHITYMRTDSTNLAKSAIEAIRKVIKKDFGSKYLPEKPNYYSKKAKVAQEAHEAIRPVNIDKKASELKLKDDQAKLYELIRKRAIASQMMPAQMKMVTVVINQETSKGIAEFRATGQKLVFAGYLKLYSDKINEQILPDKLAEKQKYAATKIFGTQHFTQPPARYTEASLIKQLEQYGIGRPSTYAPIISTIQSRNYVDKEGTQLIPTDNGRVVVRLLQDHFDNIVDYDFTAEMEEDLDKIANGEKDWHEFISKFYNPFIKQVTKKDKSIDKNDYTVLGDAPEDIICPVCKGKMHIKLSKYGKFYSCANFPDCKGMRDLSGETEEDVAKKAKSKEFLAEYEPAPKTDDGQDYLLKKGRYGEFWAHPDYPKIKDAQPLKLRPEKIRELYGEPPQTDDGEDFVFKTGRYGNFWAHPDYPKVKKTVRIKKVENT